jgi:NAD(P)-dependent dehydrogenase (short-subunit alcohol dehydrogenase family)
LSAAVGCTFAIREGAWHNETFGIDTSVTQHATSDSILAGEWLDVLRTFEGAAAVSERRTMLITGAGRGIGAAIARRAAKAGFQVIVNYGRSADAATTLATEIGNESFAVQADVGNEHQVLAMFATIDDRCGQLDSLVNNAGVSGNYGGLNTVTAEMLSELWAVNITGSFLCARETVARMPATGGTIINISSKAAVIGGANEWVHYAASKGAIESMTTGLARELAARNIRVNAVRPGLVDNNFGTAPYDRLERLAPTIPMQRAGGLDEVAEAVVWLAAEAPEYMTGSFLDVTGGR